MKAIIKRQIKSYLKNPVFWMGIFVVFVGVYQLVSPYLTIHYVEENEKLPTEEGKPWDWDGDIMDGYVPSTSEKQRELWENSICNSLMTDFEMSEDEAALVIQEIQDMEIDKACQYLEDNYKYYGADYTYEDFQYHAGSREEINQYIRERLDEHDFSYYFSRKFADYVGLYMGFFATVFLAFLFMQDMRKNTYELLHTKPIKGWKYILGKTVSGFLLMLFVLILLNVGFFVLCKIVSYQAGFSANLLDFLKSSAFYILPNMVMICSVYGFVSLLFRNPIPAVPMLILYMLYSNMLRIGENGSYIGRPLAIMVRFPGNFFDTTLPPLALLNQTFLLIASVFLFCITVYLWKRRRI